MVKSGPINLHDDCIPRKVKRLANAGDKRLLSWQPHSLWNLEVRGLSQFHQINLVQGAPRLALISKMTLSMDYAVMDRPQPGASQIIPQRANYSYLNFRQHLSAQHESHRCRPEWEQDFLANRGCYILPIHSPEVGPNTSDHK